jgi:hypothetical protein
MGSTTPSWNISFHPTLWRDKPSPVSPRCAPEFLTPPPMGSELQRDASSPSAQQDHFPFINQRLFIFSASHCCGVECYRRVAAVFRKGKNHERPCSSVGGFDCHRVFEHCCRRRSRASWQASWPNRKHEVYAASLLLEAGVLRCSSVRLYLQGSALELCMQKIWQCPCVGVPRAGNISGLTLLAPDRCRVGSDPHR